MQTLKVRSTEKELMDTEEIEFSEYHGILEQIARLNRLSLSYHLFEKFIEKMIRTTRRTDLHLFEVGYGSGDLICHLAKWGKRKGYQLYFTGIDLHPFSQRMAQRKLEFLKNVNLVCGDVFQYSPVRPIDVAYSSFVTHHFSPDELINFVAWLEENSRLGWFIHDIHRHPVPYYLLGTLTKLFQYHPMVVHDSKISVARSFLKKDWQKILSEAGIGPNEVQIKWRFPFKYCVERCKQQISM